MGSESRNPSSPEESSLPPEELARLVLHCRELELFLERVASSLPARDETPFLYRQLEDGVGRLLGHLKALQLELDEEARPSGLRRLLSKRRRSTRVRKLRHDLQGTAWTIPIPELINFLSHSSKSGVLWVTTIHETFELEFQGGNLVHASSNAPPPDLRLGEILLREGLVQPDELLVGIENARMADERLGTFLVRNGRIAEKELQRVLMLQVQELFHRILAAENATYGFQEGLRRSRSQELEVNIMQLLLESARKRDEEHRGPEPQGDSKAAASAKTAPSGSSKGSDESASPSGKSDSTSGAGAEEAVPDAQASAQAAPETSWADVATSVSDAPAAARPAAEEPRKDAGNGASSQSAEEAPEKGAEGEPQAPLPMLAKASSTDSDEAPELSEKGSDA